MICTRKLEGVQASVQMAGLTCCSPGAWPAVNIYRGTLLALILMTHLDRFLRVAKRNQSFHYSFHRTTNVLTSLAPLCICISRSISCNCCSSLNASAHGTPSNSALVLMTHSAFPLNDRPDETQAVAVLDALTSDLRYSGGTMSARAAIRSLRVSSRSEAEEMSLASDSAWADVSYECAGMFGTL